MKGKKILIANEFEGFPQDSDFQLEEFEIPSIQDGEFSFEVLYHSVDPYMRLFPSKKGDLMLNWFVISKVLESKNNAFPSGTTIIGPFGWVTHGISNGEGVQKAGDLQGLSPSLLCGALGMPGVTAYFGLLDVCCPKAGETVYINSAAGAVGSLVGQIAKFKGCKVVGSAGSEEKLQYLKDIGFDEVFNYKTVNLDEALKAACPQGIDCFFDNVGGMHFVTVLENMNSKGRVAICGCLSQYNKKEPELCPPPTKTILLKQLRLRGFMFLEFASRSDEAFNEMVQWIKEGKIQVKEDITEGFENMPKSFMGLFSGQSFGKVVVKV